MVVYDSAAIYINGTIDVCEKIKRIDAIITALENAALTGAAQGNLSSYLLDDGQTKIQTTYRNIAEIAAAITAFDVIRQRWINQKNPRMVRLIDSKNFTPHGNR